MDTNLKKLAFDYVNCKTQADKTEVVTRFNLLQYKDKIKVIHMLFKAKSHSYVKELLMTIEYRNDFPLLLSDTGIYLFYINCLYGQLYERDII